MTYTRVNWRNGEVALSDTNLNHMDQGIADAHEAIENLSSAGNVLLLALHPVGDIIFNTSGINPSTYIGGTWVQWGKGRVPVGLDSDDSDFDTAEQEGGRKDAAVPSHSHDIAATAVDVDVRIGANGDHSHSVSLTTQPSGAHYHTAKTRTGTAASGSGQRSGPWTQDTMYSDQINVRTSDVANHTHSVEGRTQSTGEHSHPVTADAMTRAGSTEPAGISDASNANLQPYITCYMWKRTA